MTSYFNRYLYFLWVWCTLGIVQPSSLEQSCTMSGSVSPPPRDGPASPSGPAITDDEPEDMFLDDVPDFLKCAICLCVLKNPFQVHALALVQCLPYMTHTSYYLKSLLVQTILIFPQYVCFFRHHAGIASALSVSSRS